MPESLSPMENGKAAGPGHSTGRRGVVHQSVAGRSRALARIRTITTGIAVGAAAVTLGLGTEFAHAIPGHSAPAGQPARGQAPRATAPRGSASPAASGGAAAGASRPGGRRHRSRQAHSTPAPRPPASSSSPPQVVSGGS